jgi:hypothetical protein
MTRTAVLVLMLALPAAATPLPEDERRRIDAQRQYGTWTDDGRSSFEVVGEEVRVRLPARTGLPAVWRRPPSVGPRFVRRVDGDFTAVVRVRCPRRPVETLGEDHYVAGGLALDDSAGNHVNVRWFERASFESDPQGERVSLACRWWSGGRSGGGERGGTSPYGHALLRMSRAGSVVVLETNWYGERWQVEDRIPLPLEQAVRVSVIAENTLGTPAEMVFDRYSLTQPKK